MCVHGYTCRRVHAQPISSPGLLRGEVALVLPSPGVVTALPLLLPRGAVSKSSSTSKEPAVAAASATVAASSAAAAASSADGDSSSTAAKLSSSVADVGAGVMSMIVLWSVAGVILAAVVVAVSIASLWSVTIGKLFMLLVTLLLLLLFVGGQAATLALRALADRDEAEDSVGEEDTEEEEEAAEEERE